MDKSLQQEMAASFEKWADQHIQKELSDLRAFKKAVQNDPDVHALYFGHYHGEPSAMDLIGKSLEMPLNTFCDLLGVERYEGYCGDGGLEDAIEHNVREILRAAGVMAKWDDEIARHPDNLEQKTPQETVEAPDVEIKQLREALEDALDHLKNTYRGMGESHDKCIKKIEALLASEKPKEAISE